MKSKKLYFLIILGGIFTYNIFNIVHSYIKLSKNMAEGIRPRVTNCYNELFLKSKSDLLKSDLTFFTKGQFPIATFNYRGNEYKIIVYKFNVQKSINLDHLINLQTEASKQTSDVVYDNLFSVHLFNYNVSNESRIVKVNTIQLSLLADSIQKTIYQENLIGYSLYLNTLGIRKNNQNETEVFINSVNNLKYIKSEVAFLKRDDAVYFMLLIPEKEREILPSRLLADLIINKN